MDGITPQTGDLAIPLAPGQPAEAVPSLDHLPPALLRELCAAAQISAVALTAPELEQSLLRIGLKYNYGQPPAAEPTTSQREAFLRSLQLPDLALAQACALGRELAWQQFMVRFRSPLQQAAIAITRSSSLGQDLADSLYSELFGLAERNGERRSPLASYGGRGSLMGWLRTTLAQRHIDHHRRTHRETPIADQDFAGPLATPAAEPTPLESARLSAALAITLRTLPADDRFLLAAYFLDQHTLLQIARVLKVHEATISRKLKRLTASLKQQLLKNLQATGMSQRAAEEALGIDPRDLAMNLRAILQTSANRTFQPREELVPPQP